MIYLTSSINELETEGIGSRLHSALATELLCGGLGVEYHPTPIKNLYHRPETMTDGEWCGGFNDLFNIEPKKINFKKTLTVNDLAKQHKLPQGKVTNLSQLQKIIEGLIIPFPYNNTDFFRKSWKNWGYPKDDILLTLDLPTPKKLLDKNFNIFTKLLMKPNRVARVPIVPELNLLTEKKINVAIHLRVWNHFDMDYNGVRNYFRQNTETEVFYQNVIKVLNEQIGKENVIFHIFTQDGFIDEEKNTPVDFTNLEDENIIIHKDVDTVKTLYNFINSDILIQSNSSLSYVGNLFHTGLCFVRHDFWHKVPNQPVIVLSDGTLKVEEMVKLTQHLKKTGIYED